MSGLECDLQSLSISPSHPPPAPDPPVPAVVEDNTTPTGSETSSADTLTTKAGVEIEEEETEGNAFSQASSSSSDACALDDEKDCEICCEVVARCDYPELPPSCAHESDACGGCMSKYLSGEIADNGAHTSIECMQAGCTTQLGLSIVRGLVRDQDTLHVFEQNSIRENFRCNMSDEFFECPAPDCDGWQLHEGGTLSPIVSCAVCGGQFCFKHRVPWHSSVSCEEYERLSPQHQAQITNLENIKRCPSCNILVEKVDGCDAVTCRAQTNKHGNRNNVGCGFKFCWQCNAPYHGKEGILANDNSKHKSHCIHYPAPDDGTA